MIYHTSPITIFVSHATLSFQYILHSVCKMYVHSYYMNSETRYIIDVSLDIRRSRLVAGMRCRRSQCLYRRRWSNMTEIITKKHYFITHIIECNCIIKNFKQYDSLIVEHMVRLWNNKLRLIPSHLLLLLNSWTSFDSSSSFTILLFVLYCAYFLNIFSWYRYHVWR